MNFLHPGYLLVGALACVALVAIWWRQDVRQRAALGALVAPHLRAQLTASVSRVRRLAQRAFFGAAVALLFVALAAPQLGYRWEATTRRGNDIMFAVDTSRSMLTPDVKPNRLARAKLAIDDFVAHLDGDAVGLVAFAGTAFLQTPLTLDYGAFHESLSALDTHIIPVGGTNISSAIRETQAALRDRPDSDKILILVTDGEDLKGDALATAKAAARQDGLKIFAVGVGTANGDLIPLPQGGFLKDDQGQLVKSHLDESGLKALATATGGSYAPLGNANQGLDTIYRDALAPLAKHDLQARSQKVFTQRYQWPLAASLILLLCSLVIGTRRRTASTGLADATASVRPSALPLAVALLLAAALSPIGSARASPESAQTAYDRGNFAAAEQTYAKAAEQSPQTPLLQFNVGAAAYKAGDYPRASQAFAASLAAVKSGSTTRLAEQEDAYYNLGNTLYREGQKAQQSNADDTITTWGKSVKAYDAALQLRAGDADAKFNRDLVQRKLDALKKQQDQKRHQQQQQQQQQQSPPRSSAGQESKSGSSKDNPGKGKTDSKDQAGQATSSSAADLGPSPASTSLGSAKADAAGNKDSAQQPAQQSGSRPANAAGASAGAAPPAGSAAGAWGSSEQQAAQAADDQRAPGEMSRAEARELLDSVRDEQRLPASPVTRSGVPEISSSDRLKDW